MFKPVRKAIRMWPTPGPAWPFYRRCISSDGSPTHSRKKHTGGKVFLVSNLSDLVGEYAKIAQQLRKTYTVAYYPRIREGMGP
jgi:hypothetical protein